MKKQRLSYSTLNSAILSPHTYLNKISGLKTFSIYDFEAGKMMHRIIQDHCSGFKEHELLQKLPKFSMVEQMDRDPNLEINFSINDKYDMIGYVDMKDPETFSIGEIKSGRVWSVGDFARLPQWKIYAIGLPEYRKIYLVNTPKVLEEWKPENIRIYSKDITPQDIEQGWIFIRKGLHVIENLRDSVENEIKIRKEKGYTGRDRNCFYTDCSYCGI